jgi:hypothetical protein
MASDMWGRFSKVGSASAFAQHVCACAALQIKDAVRDGLRAVKNVIDDKAVVLGAGAFEVAAAQHLRETVKKQVGVDGASGGVPNSVLACSTGRL